MVIAGTVAGTAAVVIGGAHVAGRSDGDGDGDGGEPGYIAVVSAAHDAKVAAWVRLEGVPAELQQQSADGKLDIWSGNSRQPVHEGTESEVIRAAKDDFNSLPTAGMCGQRRGWPATCIRQIQRATVDCGVRARHNTPTRDVANSRVSLVQLPGSNCKQMIPGKSPGVVAPRIRCRHW